MERHSRRKCGGSSSEVWNEHWEGRLVAVVEVYAVLYLCPMGQSIVPVVPAEAYGGGFYQGQDASHHMYRHCMDKLHWPLDLGGGWIGGGVQS